MPRLSLCLADIETKPNAALFSGRLLLEQAAARLFNNVRHSIFGGLDC